MLWASGQVPHLWVCTSFLVGSHSALECRVGKNLSPGFPSSWGQWGSGGGRARTGVSPSLTESVSTYPAQAAIPRVWIPLSCSGGRRADIWVPQCPFCLASQLFCNCPLCKIHWLKYVFLFCGKTLTDMLPRYYTMRKNQKAWATLNYTDSSQFIVLP